MKTKTKYWPIVAILVVSALGCLRANDLYPIADCGIADCGLGAVPIRNPQSPIRNPLDTVPITKRGITPARNLRNYDYDQTAGKFGQVLGNRTYPSGSGCDTCVGFLPLYVVSGSVAYLGSNTLLHTGNIGTLGYLTSVSTTARLTGNGTSGSPLDLASVISPGSCTICTIGTDAYGRVTSRSSGTVALNSQTTGVLAATNGGTGQSSYTVGDLLFANTSTTLFRLADVATGNALISGGVGVAPAWGKIGLTTHVSGTLPIGNGGTGLASIGTANQLIRVNAGATALEYFTPTYLTANQTITLSGDVTGSGSTSIITTIGTGAVTSAKILDGTIAASDLSALGATSSGQVLTWNGSAWAAAAASGGITGSGTTNYLPKWTGTSALGNSLYFDSGTATGINTASPEALLHVFQGSAGSVTAIGSTVLALENSTHAYVNLLVPSGSAAGLIVGQGTNNAYTGFTYNRNVANQWDITTNVAGAMSGLTLQNTNNSNTSSHAVMTIAVGGGSAGDAYTKYLISGARAWGWGVDNSANDRVVLSNGGEPGVGDMFGVETNGNAFFAGILQLPDGSASAPAYTFTNDLDVGVFRPTTNTLAFSTGGTERLRLGSLGEVYFNGAAGSSGQVLQSNGSASAPTWVTISALPSGTTGQTLRHNGTAWVASSTLTNDGTNLSTTGTFSTALGSAGSPALTFTGDSNTGIYSPGGDVLGFATGGVLRMNINNNGESKISSVGTGATSSVLTMYYAKSTTPADDDGVRIDFNLKDGAGNETIFNRIEGVADNVANGLESGGIDFKNALNGILTLNLQVNNSWARAYVPMMPGQYTATAASAISATNGMLIYVTSTNGTFTSVGFWGRENGAWVKL